MLSNSVYNLRVKKAPKNPSLDKADLIKRTRRPFAHRIMAVSIDTCLHDARQTNGVQSTPDNSNLQAK